MNVMDFFFSLKCAAMNVIKRLKDFFFSLKCAAMKSNVIKRLKDFFFSLKFFLRRRRIQQDKPGTTVDMVLSAVKTKSFGVLVGVLLLLFLVALWVR
jgi:hypothetical protein